jgi:hypothetical protein
MALIAAMPDDFPPVSVEIRPDSFRTIRTVQQASELVLTWPQGRRRLLAMKACLASLEGAETPENARQCFIEAAEEAGVFVKEGELFRRHGS